MGTDFILLLDTWSWSQFVLLAQGIVFVCLLGVAVVYSLRMGSTKAWKERAEERKEAISDLEGDNRRLEKQLLSKISECENAELRRREAEDRANEASRFNFELQGKLRVYERRHGLLKPEDFNS